MVAKIKVGKNLRGALHYNERKVAEGKAELILGSGFAGNIERLNFHQKFGRFKKLLDLNPKVRTNTLHISLNFDAKEKLDDAKMQMIAIAYMERIGFGDQPFLCYRHNDAAHDHLHIVSTNIQANAKAIGLHGIGWQRSEVARKEIEEEFGLIKAHGKNYKPGPAIKPIDIGKVIYGKIPTKRAISNTVDAVVNSYKFASIAEMNAVLRQFNVIADRGAIGSAMFEKKGLLYSLLDEQGEKVGVPIKASSLYNKPTLARLEERFGKNKEKRQAFKPSVRARIDRVLNLRYLTERTFLSAMQKHGINVLFRRSDTGKTYGITFVDHRSRSVFNGSELGKAYSAGSITEQFRPERSLQKTNEMFQMTGDHMSNDKFSLSITDPSATLLNPVEQNGPRLLKKQRRKNKKINI